MGRNVCDDDLRVLQASSRDPFARSGDRGLGNVCAKHIATRADAPRQLENCRAGPATDVEDALAWLGRREVQQLLR
jgi:hypothetical protein